MNRIALLISILLLFVSCAPKAGREMPSRTPSNFSGTTKLQFETWTLANGIKVLYAQDSELPIVQGVLYIPGGSYAEKPDQAYIVEIMGGQMRQGGAGNFGAEQLDIELDKLGASIGSDFDGEFGKISFSCLSADFQQVFSMFSEVVQRPRFEQARLNLWKSQSIDVIRRRVDDADTVARIAEAQLLYQGTPYQPVLDESDVNAVTRDAIVSSYRRYLKPQGAILVVTGKIDRAQLAQQLEASFSGWNAQTPPLARPPLIEREPKGGIYFVELPFTQSTVIMTHLGVPRLSPDQYAINVFNFIFGNGMFASKLMQRIRTKLGLAYWINGSIQPAVVKGKNQISFQTKSETTGIAILQSLDVLNGMKSNFVTPAELNEAKDYVQNSFIFNFSSAAQILNRKALIELLSYPADYDKNYVSNVLAVTAEEVREVARKHWDIGKMQIIVVGDKAAYNSLKGAVNNSQELKRLGDVRRVKFDQKLIL